MPCIEDYAFISDCHSGALVGRDGSIDWMCLPRFDSPSCFGALLGSEDHGFWRIRPVGEYKSSRRYVGHSMVLETVFETATGSCRLVDGMLRHTPEPDLLRLVEGLTGEVEMEMELVIRFEYGSVVPWVKRTGDRSFHAVAGPDAVEFTSSVDFVSKDLRTKARFRVRRDERYPFTIVWHASHLPVKQPILDPCGALEATVRDWEDWASQCAVKGEGRECLLRCLLVLKGLTYAPTGGIVAAPTTSLPEDIGGERNWDYRYCWVRDSTYALYALLLAGYREEAQAWLDWLLRAVAGTPSQVNIMYGLSGERRLTEVELPWLPGYEASAPVRIGNAAYQQLQHDIFGETLDTAWLALKGGMTLSRDAWAVLRKMLTHLETTWQKPDRGIWEVRGPERHFTHSKVMAWVAFDRGIKIIHESGLEGPVDRWSKVRDEIRAEVCDRGYNRKIGCFTQFYGASHMDASLLMLPLVGFLPASDPRITRTVAEIERTLMHEGLLKRYHHRETQDGLRGGEGVFLACSFWLVNVYVLQGRHAKARELFETLKGLCNDVGLLAEEYDPVSRRMLGNFPQAFSLLALASSAFHFYSDQSPVRDRCEGSGKVRAAS